jgi:8-oxo-dGTP pyrophosphatase MutT (NUDIX family)
VASIEPVTAGWAAIGAAVAIIDPHDHVLLVRHSYGRLNWELPGGGALPNEAPDATARRELLEETGLRAALDRLTGVYFEPGHEAGPMLHFVFAVRWSADFAPAPASPEISELRYWPLDGLPTPISDFTERRARDAASATAAGVSLIATRIWRE